MDRERKMTHRFLQECLAASPEPAAKTSAQPLSESEWAEVFALAERHGVTPLLYERLNHGAPGFVVPEAVLQRLREAYLINGARNTLVYRELARILEALRQSSIPVIVLKGAHLAAAVYGEVALRKMNDIDLLVGVDDLERAAATLSGLGYLGEMETPDAAWRATHWHLPRMFGPPAGPAIEIHWTITQPFKFGQLTLSGLWDRSRLTTIAGVPARVLSPEDLLLHVCLHTAMNDNDPFHLGLRPLCDLAAIVHRFQHEMDWPAAQSRAREWGADRCVYLALSLARRLMAAEVPEAILESFRPQSFEARWAELAVRQTDLCLSSEAERAAVPFRAWTMRRAARPDRARLSVLMTAIFPSRNDLAAYMAATHGVRVGARRRDYWYLTRAVDLLVKGVRSVWHWPRHRREAAWELRRLRQGILLHDWLVAANPEGSCDGRTAGKGHDALTPSRHALC